MKSFAILVAFLTTAFCASTDAQSWQELSTNLFTNCAIIWKVPPNQLPQSLWVYRRILPHVFPQTVISNAVVLGSLQSRGIPQSSTNESYILEKKPPDWPGMIPTLLDIRPDDAHISFSIPANGPISKKGIPDDATLIKIARKCAGQLGLDPAKLEHEKIYTHSCDTGQGDNNFCGRGVFFPRYLDGIAFFSAVNDGEGAEGFSMEFGEDGKIRAFSVRWSALERYRNERVASLNEISRCIRAHKVIVIPNFKSDDFVWLKKLAMTKELTITKITPYYGEGIFGEVPTNDAPCKLATPFAELKAVADLDNGNSITVRLLSPILSSEVVGIAK